MSGRTACFIGSVIVLTLSLACQRDGTLTSPTPAANPGPRRNGTGFVHGVILREVPLVGRITVPPQPVAHAEVIVIAGPAEGHTTFTDASGAYGINLPPGPFRLRSSSQGYLSVLSTERTVTLSENITMPDVVLRTAPWTIGGVVTDSPGNAVEGATVTVCCSGPVGSPFGTAITGGDGRYRITSSAVRGASVSVSARKEGYERMIDQRVECCGLSNEATQDLRLVRVLSVAVTGPGTLRVGESVELPPATISLDTGSQRLVYLLPASSSPGEVAVERGVRGFVLRGVKAGISTITFEFEGVRAVLQVRVVD